MMKVLLAHNDHLTKGYEIDLVLSQRESYVQMSIKNVFLNHLESSLSNCSCKIHL